MPAQINISQIPNNLKTPGFYFQVDASGAGTAQFNQRTLLLGRKNTAAGASANSPIQVVSVGEALTNFGEGSPLHLMAKAFFKANPAAELWAMPTSIAGTSRTHAFDLGAEGTITAITLTADGVKYELDSTDPTAIAAEINLIADLPFEATEASDVVTLTAKANGVDEYYSVSMANGATNISPTTAAGTGAATPSLTALGDFEVDFYIVEQPNSNYLNAVKSFVDDRWEALAGLYGHAIAARGNAGTSNLTPTQALTAAVGRNGGHETIVALNSDMPNHVLAAAIGGTAVRELIADPARPIQTVVVRGILPPTQGNIWAQTERNTLNNGGIATCTVSPTGEVAIERMVTTYRTDVNGNSDNAWLDIQTPLTLMKFMREQIAMLRRNYGRAKLADDGTRVLPGSTTVTPSMIKSAIVSLYRKQVDNGLVEGWEEFQRDLVVQRNATDRNRVDCILPANIQNQLRVLAALVSFKL